MTGSTLTPTLASGCLGDAAVDFCHLAYAARAEPQSVFAVQVEFEMYYLATLALVLEYLCGWLGVYLHRFGLLSWCRGLSHDNLGSVRSNHFLTYYKYISVWTMFQ
jgi:hypothetical protein